MRYFIYCRKSSEAEDRQALSIDSQHAELVRAFGADPEIEIVDVYREAASAKAPGRPIFNEMLRRLERGDAEGILAWHPDRLARNSIDGGAIVYLLDRRVLTALRFATFTFENNSQGKFMLQITFGYSKYYVDSLSENVKRGNRAKIERGWRPNAAPLGYLNNRDTGAIDPDPLRFPLIRRMFEFMLTGAYGPKEIAIKARDEWGFQTPKRKRSGGNPIALSTIYRILGNRFYTGDIVWNGQVHPGKHQPVVSHAEFERVQELLGRPGRPRPHTRVFDFMGMMRCGACGLMITAEEKHKGGRAYIYYHCTKRRLTERCREPYVPASSLDQQIEEYLRHLYVAPNVHKVVLQKLRLRAAGRQREVEVQKLSLEASLGSVAAQSTELTSMRLKALIGDDEFRERRAALAATQTRLADERARLDKLPTSWFELAEDTLMFRSQAADWFRYGDRETRRLILETVGSNLTLTRKILSIQARKPFSPTPFAPGVRQLRAVVDDVGTRENMPQRQQAQQLINDIATFMCDESDENIKLQQHVKKLCDQHREENEKAA